MASGLQHHVRISRDARRCLLAAFVALLLLCVHRAQAFDTVVIDAGHGGDDRGGIPGQRVSEKAMTLDVARRLEGHLRSAGFRTVMTRRTDSYVPLSTRVAIGNRQRNAVFVSIHFNSARRVGAVGTETFYYSAASRPLAASIQRGLVSTVAMEDRGLKRRGFYVLRHSRIPAVLVEGGFLTNPTEARRISQASHRERLAREIADAVVESRGSGRFGRGSLQASR